MNKYQEALEHQQEMLDRYDLHWSNDELVANRTAYCTLEELVDRATPKKVENWGYSEWEEGDYLIKSSQSGDCPNCHTRITMLDDEIHFCPHCGKALDWEGK